MPAPQPPPDLPAAEFKRWPFWRRWLGERSERAAAKFLRGLGYRLVAANLADRRGELDLLALDGKTLVVVEVRSTSSRDPLRAAESVDLRKQRRVTEAALRFLARRGLLGVSVRFDVLAISWPPDRAEPLIRHFPNAFDAVGRFEMWN